MTSKTLVARNARKYKRWCCIIFIRWRQSWRAAADCKSVPFWVSGFESHPSHLSRQNGRKHNVLTDYKIGFAAQIVTASVVDQERWLETVYACRKLLKRKHAGMPLPRL